MLNNYGHTLTISGINSLTITGLGENATEINKKWNSAIYTNTSGDSKISISATESINVSGASMAVHALGGVIALDAKTVNLAGGNAVVAQDGGQIAINAETFIAKTTSTAICSKSFGNQTGEHSINITAKTVYIESENGAAVNTDSYGSAIIQAEENLTLIGKTSAIVVGSEVMPATLNDRQDSNQGAQLTLQGHTVTIKGDNDALLMYDGGQLNLETEKLVANGNIVAENGSVHAKKENTVISLNGEGTSATINKLTGQNITFEFDHFNENGTVLDIENNAAQQVSSDFTAKAVDKFSADDAKRFMTRSVNFGYDADGEKATGNVNGYGTNFTVAIDKDGNASTQGSDITKSTMDMAAMSLISWRNEVTSLTDRLSTLRTTPSEMGAWVRYNGGQYKYDARGMKNTFHTVEVGADTKLADTPWTVGATFAYTNGNGDFQQGETESDTYSGALYAMYSQGEGAFIDVMAKLGRIGTDYDFYNQKGGATDKASLDRTGLLLGIETGYRFNVTDVFFVEPQLQLTFSRLNSVYETTSARTVDLDKSDSLIGRVGLMAGINCPNDRGSAFVRVSALRDFRGEITGTFSTGAGTEYRMDQDLDDNWFEFALGANYRVNDSVMLYADVQKSAGAEIDLEWRANAGVRMSF